MKTANPSRFDPARTSTATQDRSSPVHLHTSVPSPSPIKQIDGLQILRAVAVIQIAWTHSFQHFQSYGPANLPTFGIVGIDIFFVISGFIISTIVLHSRQQPGFGSGWHFLKRRFIRIYPIYWIFALIGLARMVHNGYIHKANFAPAFFLVPWPTFWRIYGLTWTLMFEVMFYFTVGLVLFVTVKRAVPVIVTVFGLSGLWGCIHGLPSPFWIMASNPMLLEFVFGAVLALLFKHFGRRRALGIPLLILGAVGIYLLQIFPPPGAYTMAQILTGDHVGPRPFTWGFASALLVSGMVFWSPQIKSKPGWLAVIIGNSSYSAYLASTLVMEFTYRGLIKLVPPHSALGLPLTLFYACTIVATVILVGWVSYQFVEWPMVRRLQKLAR